MMKLTVDIVRNISITMTSDNEFESGDSDCMANIG